MNTSIGQENNEEIYEKQHIHIPTALRHRAFFHTILDATGAALFLPRRDGLDGGTATRCGAGIRDMIPSGKQTVCY